MKTLHNILPRDLVDMAGAAKGLAVKIETAYARADNVLFSERIYREDARLWLYKDLADIILRACEALNLRGYRLILYDGLRTVDAQARMLKTQRVQDNPHWLEAPRLLSAPGTGAHPRAMAIDCSIETLDGELLDMGTPFDFLAKNSAPAHNRAHRKYPHHCDAVMRNRAVLDHALLEAAEALQTSLFLLPQEWWDFRLPPEIYDQYAPLKDDDLPPEMRMVG